MLPVFAILLLVSAMRSQRITVPQFTALKAEGRKISMVTAYDYPMARLVDAAGVEGILVGDSMSMVIQGHDSTLPVTLDEMIYHAEMVGRAVEHALVIVDMPFPSFHLGKYKAIENAGRILKESRCQAVKLEGGVEQADTIAALVSAGIPVMAHCGLRPQSVHQLGGYRVQRDEAALAGRRPRGGGRLARLPMVLECIPREIAKKITAEIAIPTIGIGAGADCDGQVLVLHDLLGHHSRVTCRNSSKAYADLKTEMTRAVSAVSRRGSQRRSSRRKSIGSSDSVAGTSRLSCSSRREWPILNDWVTILGRCCIMFVLIAARKHRETSAGRAGAAGWRRARRTSRRRADVVGLSTSIGRDSPIINAAARAARFAIGLRSTPRCARRSSAASSFLNAATKC